MRLVPGDGQAALIDLEPDPGPLPRPSRKQLTLRQVAEWSRRQARAIAAGYCQDRRSMEFVLAQAVKLGEEVGELHAEVLGRAKWQRSGKRAQYGADGLAGELADVTICVAILAEAVGVDLEEALRSKMAQIEARSAG